MQHSTAKEKKHLHKKEKIVQHAVILNATSGDLKGEIDLSWEPVSTANSYILQKSTSANKPLKWKYEDIVAKSSYTVSNLKSNHCYWFRLSAVTPTGKTGWSMPIKKKAP